MMLFSSHHNKELYVPLVFTKSYLQNHEFIFNQLNDFDESKIKLQVAKKENGSNWLKLRDSLFCELP